MTAIIWLIKKFPKGSIWEERYVGFPLLLVVSTLVLSRGSLSVVQKGIWFGFGIVSWTFLEYVLHRWILHWSPRGMMNRVLMDRLHILHHNNPADDTQVCIPLLFSVVVWSAIYLVLWLLGAHNHAVLLFICGSFLMMIVYDIVHYSTHYMKAKNPYLKILKKHHMQHHFSDHTKRFGVTSPFWDIVFRTYS